MMTETAAYVRECQVAHVSQEGCHDVATDTFICRCLRITESEIHEVADTKCEISVREITRQTGAGAGCTACHKLIRALLAARKQQRAANSADMREPAAVESV